LIEKTPFCNNCALSFSLKNSAICNPSELKKLEFIENFDTKLLNESKNMQKLLNKIIKKDQEVKNGFFKKKEHADSFFESFINGAKY